MAVENIFFVGGDPPSKKPKRGGRGSVFGFFALGDRPPA